MNRTFTAQQILQIRRRHQGYQLLLVTMTLIVLSQPLALQWPLLNSIEAICLALVMVLYLIRYSPLRSRKRLIYSLALAAVLIELVWFVILWLVPALSPHMAIPHLLIWTFFISTFLSRKVRALMIEPFVTPAVVMGAAAGYLLIGYLGGFLLHSLLLWQPAAFDFAALPVQLTQANWPRVGFPAMVLASFGALTTVGTAVGRQGHLLVPTASILITIAGQLYVAVLIALILGRFHWRS